MAASPLDCWKCGASLADLSLPLGRADSCLACRADLHVCRMCRFYDVTKANQCAEPVAEPVSRKDRANFCGYFVPVSGRYQARDGTADAARDALEALFGSKK